MTTTVYVSIGNSDDKLSQAEWAKFLREFIKVMRRNTTQVYGEWYSSPESEYQNACMAVAVPDEHVGWLRAGLQALRDEFRQDSVAWAEVPTTEFI